jgi:DNA-binding NarL/FixJ family response regulator
VVWEAARCLADLRTRALDRHEEVPASVVTSAARWAASVGSLPVDTEHARAYSHLVVAENAGVGADHQAAWADAVASCRAAQDPYLVAYALGRLAESRVAAADREGAVVDLRESRGIARRLGAQPLVIAADQLARRARLNLDEEVDRTSQAAPDDTLARLGLTERERDVLALVAAGSPNNEIAKRLFISPKTVSVHVSNILAKLQVKSRVEAAAVAHRNGLLGPDQR